MDIRMRRTGGQIKPAWQESIVELCTDVIVVNSSASACNACSAWQHGALLLDSQRSRRLEPDVVSFGAAVSGCERSCLWQRALGLMGTMTAQLVPGNIIVYSSTLSCCGKARAWRQALLSKMLQAQLKPNIITYNSSISAFERAEWQIALSAFMNLRCAQLEGNSRSYRAALGAIGESHQWWQVMAMIACSEAAVGLNNQLLSTAIGAFEQCEQWDRALSLIYQAQQEGFPIDLITCNRALSACATCARWQEALLLVRELRQARVQADRVTFNTLMHATGQGRQWQQALLWLERLDSSREADEITYVSAMAACTREHWARALQIFAAMLGRRLGNDFAYNSAITACQNGHQWQHSMHLMFMMAAASFRPSVICWDSVMLACLGRNEELAFQSFLESAPLREPVSFLWALAALGHDLEPVVIHRACRDALNVNFSKTADLARLWWSAAALGASSRRLRGLASACHLSAFSLEDLSMAVTGISALDPLNSLDQDFLLDAQKATEQWLRRAEAWQLAFAEQGQDLLAILFSCRMSRCLRTGLLQLCQKAMRTVGRSLDADGVSKDVGASGLLTALDQNDRLVLMKPAGWEVFGQHVEHQLLEVTRPLGFPIFEDPSHNFGFLHRLDVPSSGLILAAKSYEAFYDLQVQLHAGAIKRDYTALCHGWAKVREIRARTRSRDGRPTKSGGQGKPSCSVLALLQHLQMFGALSQLLITIVTGRKHQIRSHLAHVGHPVVRDRMYTSWTCFQDDGKHFARNWLHRHQITFRCADGKPCHVVCQLPADLDMSLRHARVVRRGKG
ncbi:unnamed protein product [Effrenium voratum]|uniref:Pseudouridine synthase RsuA/RluA-like domain-containing protein n=1 Tax=Effrenium voratum TaxID=2562239 RepID=A0AA36JQ45_9DINO|nr:unnamed protein product [Effrenium voratum]